MNIVQTMRVVSIAFFTSLTWCMAVLPPPAIAQRGTQGAAAEDDAGEREPKRVAIRFLTESDFPPFNYFDEENVLTGFNIDVARAICLELAAACDIVQDVADFNSIEVSPRFIEGDFSEDAIVRAANE